MNKPFYKSKKFWMSILSIFLPFANKKLGLGLNTEELVAAASGPVSYILGQSVVDTKLYAAKTSLRKAQGSAKDLQNILKGFSGNKRPGRPRKTATK